MQVPFLSFPLPLSLPADIEQEPDVGMTQTAIGHEPATQPALTHFWRMSVNIASWSTWTLQAAAVHPERAAGASLLQEFPEPVQILAFASAAS